MKKLALFLLMTILLGSLSACGGKAGESDQDIAQSVAATQTKMAWEASVETARQTEEAAAAAEPEPTPEPEIVHLMLPDGPGDAFNSFLTDFNSIDYAEEGITYGDQFFMNRYERPFTVEMVEYRGYLDIIRVDLDFSPPWFYLNVHLADDLPESSGALYAVELDLDVDARGDYLIQAPLPPASGDWTVEGVTVREDSNEDVGGEVPLITEELPEDQQGDGFDLVIFDSGQGEDPDLAWVRRHPEDAKILQFAFKSDLAENTGFLWNVWADEGLRDPSLADYNDRFTFEQAGSPYPEHQFYPIQEISLLDSTCRSWYGFEPEGNEVGLCQVHTSGRGYKICLTYTTGRYSFTNCDTVCLEECPAGLPRRISDNMEMYCERCTLPD